MNSPPYRLNSIQNKKYDKIRIYKDKQYIIFEIDNNKNIYDINEDDFENCPDMPVLLNIYLKDVETYFEDEIILTIFKIISNLTDHDDLYSIVKCFKHYKNLEQIYSAGLKVYIYKPTYDFGGYSCFDYTINNIPKGLRKICKENNLYLTNQMVSSYLKIPDIFNIIYFMKDQYTGLKKTDLKTLTEYKYHNLRLLLVHLNDFLGYDIKKFVLYLDKQKTEKKFRNLKNFLSDYKDYINMAARFYPEYEKYPEDFTEAHDNLVEIYNQYLNEKDKDVLKKQNDGLSKKYKPEYELEYGNYKFIYPRKAEDIRKEGCDNHNCVATYINKVINGSCDILFLRHKDDLNKSLVTVEVVKGKIVQARRVCNSKITDEDREAINYFNKTISGYKDDFENKFERDDDDVFDDMRNWGIV